MTLLDVLLENLQGLYWFLSNILFGPLLVMVCTIFSVPVVALVTYGTLEGFRFRTLLSLALTSLWAFFAYSIFLWVGMASEGPFLWVAS